MSKGNKFDPIDTQTLRPTLVEVYRVYPYKKLIQMYYKWNFPNDTPTKTKCPGCDKTVGAYPLEHKCGGAQMPNPIPRHLHRAQGSFISSKKQQDRELQEYLSKLQHSVTIVE